MHIDGKKILPNPTNVIGKYGQLGRTRYRQAQNVEATKLAKGKQKMLENQKRTVRQEKAAGRLGTKMRSIILNLRSKPRAYK